MKINIEFSKTIEVDTDGLNQYELENRINAAVANSLSSYEQDVKIMCNECKGKQCENCDSGYIFITVGVSGYAVMRC